MEKKNEPISPRTLLVGATVMIVLATTAFIVVGRISARGDDLDLTSIQQQIRDFLSEGERASDTPPAPNDAYADNRFVTYTKINAHDGFGTVIDMETGAIYLCWCTGRTRNAVGGITPLLDADGKPTYDKEFIRKDRDETSP